MFVSMHGKNETGKSNSIILFDFLAEKSKMKKRHETCDGMIKLKKGRDDN